MRVVAVLVPVVASSDSNAHSSGAVSLLAACPLLFSSPPLYLFPCHVMSRPVMLRRRHGVESAGTCSNVVELSSTLQKTTVRIASVCTSATKQTYRHNSSHLSEVDPTFLQHGVFKLSGHTSSSVHLLEECVKWIQMASRSEMMASCHRCCFASSIA